MNIRHDERRRRFVTAVEGGEAVLDYDKVADDTLDYKHTFVPPEHRGRGIAGRLVRHALDYARDHDLKIIPTCPFVASVIRDHPEYDTLVADGG